jgi:putative tricarboxylic transport membrane protein
MSKPADGFTLMALTQTHLYTMVRGKSEMKIEDLVGVARAMDDPTFIAVSSDSDNKSLDDLVKASKEKPLNWGVAQIGGTEHIGLALFGKAASIEYKPVALGSGMQMVQGLMSGAIDATLPNVSEAKEQVSEGALRPLAVMAKERLADYPDVPTTFELGYDVATSTTRGYAVRAGTPPERVAALSEALTKAMQHETFASYLKGAGLNPESSIAGSEVWTAQLQEEYAKAATALQELGIGDSN